MHANIYLLTHVKSLLRQSSNHVNTCTPHISFTSHMLYNLYLVLRKTSLNIIWRQALYWHQNHNMTPRIIKTWSITNLCMWHQTANEIINQGANTICPQDAKHDHTHNHACETHKLTTQFESNAHTHARQIKYRETKFNPRTIARPEQA